MHLGFKLLTLHFIILCVTFPALAQLEVPPHIKWKTLKSAHFEVIYPEEKQDLGLLYLEKLELAHKRLQPYFISFPKNKTVVVINDKTDITNGYATRIPYPHIMAYPVLPGPEESLADYGDWAFELLVHEYAHILNFEPANGIMKPLRFIFGNVIGPTMLLPTWWKEGLAVELETRTSHRGRLRSPYQEATVRAMVLEQTLMSYDISKINEYTPTWPMGMRPYLFGSYFWSYAVQLKTPTITSQLNEAHGTYIPYLLEGLGQSYLGKNYTQTYQDMLHDLTTRVSNQLNIIRSVPPTQDQIRAIDFTATMPALSPDGSILIYIAEDDAHTKSLKILHRKNDQSFLSINREYNIKALNESVEAVAPRFDGPTSGSIKRISWFPDSQRVVYDRISFINRIERFSDLYILDLAKQQNRQITKGLRAREPAVSPDGQTVVFIKVEGGRTHLCTLQLANSQHQCHLSGKLQERFSYPIFWSEHEIIVSYKTNLNTEHLHRYDLRTGEFQSILTHHSIARFALKTSEGLLFTSQKNGVSNLYVTPDLQSDRALTNSETGYFLSTLDERSQELIATKMTSQGHHLSFIAKANWLAQGTQLPQVPLLLEDRYAKVDLPEPTELQYEVHPYRPHSYLLPQYWIPFIAGSSSEAGLIVTAQTTGFDPLKKHSYALLGTWDTGTQRGSLEGSYLNQTTRLPFSIGLYQHNSYLGTLDNRLEDVGGSVSLLPDMFWASRYMGLQMGAQYIQRSTPTASHLNSKRLGPFAILRFANYVTSGEQISPESGRSAYLGAYHYIEQEGYLSHSQFIFGSSAYFSRFLPKHHALYLRLNGIYIPQEVSSIFGVSSQPFTLVQDSPLPQYILRGYRRGQVYGRNLLAATLEYRFPIKNFYRGYDLIPFFARRISGALVADGMAADGVFINQKALRAERIRIPSRSFWSAGAEARFETTLGYIAPINFILGYYYAFNTGAGGEGIVGTSVQISGF